MDRERRAGENLLTTGQRPVHGGVVSHGIEKLGLTEPTRNATAVGPVN